MADDTKPSGQAALVLDAYRRAWKLRRATGNDSPDLLTNEWRGMGWAPTKLERELWMGAWDASIAPRRMTSYILNWVGRETLQLAKDIRDVINDPELPDWLLPPPGHKMLSVGFVSGDIEKRSIPFAPDAESSAAVERMLTLREKKDGYRKVRVWLKTGRDPSRVAVMAGVSRVGWTSLDDKQMRRLRPRPWTRNVKVADGNLKFTLTPGGDLDAGKLKVHLPPPR